MTEFLSQGSLRGVLARKSDVIQGPLVRVLIAMDAAKVMPQPPLLQCSALRQSGAASCNVHRQKMIWHASSRV